MDGMSRVHSVFFSVEKGSLVLVYIEVRYLFYHLQFKKIDLEIIANKYMDDFHSNALTVESLTRSHGDCPRHYGVVGNC